MKKKFILWIVVCVVIGLFCILCVKSNEEKEAEDSYAIFTEEYENISKNYSLDGFERVGKDNETFEVAFPENEYFEEKEDLIDGNSSQPVRRTLYYKNEKDGLVLTITHLYSEKKRQKFQDTEIKAFKKYVRLLKDEETKNSTKK